MLDTSNRNTPKRVPLHPNSSGECGVRRGICPSCGTESTFVFHGEQRWPDKVADKLGMKPLMHLWTCDSCHSTFAEPTDDTA